MFAGSVLHNRVCMSVVHHIHYTRLSRFEWTIKQTEDDSDFTHLQVRNLYTSTVWCISWCITEYVLYGFVVYMRNVAKLGGITWKENDQQTS